VAFADTAMVSIEIRESIVCIDESYRECALLEFQLGTHDAGLLDIITWAEAAQMARTSWQSWNIRFTRSNPRVHRQLQSRAELR
jgi:hypothetical protein